jgi:hypothetical protein
MIFGFIDSVFGLGVTQRSLSEKIEDYRVFRDHPSNLAVLAELATLDAKSNSLLQHVSIMIASLSVLIAIKPPETVRIFLFVNIAGYLLLVLMALRVIVSVNFTNDPDAEEKLLRELRTRERYYLVAHSIASVLTAILFISIMAGMVFYR